MCCHEIRSMQELSTSSEFQFEQKLSPCTHVQCWPELQDKQMLTDARRSFASRVS